MPNAGLMMDTEVVTLDVQDAKAYSARSALGIAGEETRYVVFAEPTQRVVVPVDELRDALPQDAGEAVTLGALPGILHPTSAPLEEEAVLELVRGLGAPAGRIAVVNREGEGQAERYGVIDDRELERRRAHEISGGLPVPDVPRDPRAARRRREPPPARSRVPAARERAGGFLFGKVTKASAPVADAKAGLIDSDREALSKANGSYVLGPVAPGEQVLKVVAGDEEALVNVEVKDGEAREQDVAIP